MFFDQPLCKRNLIINNFTRIYFYNFASAAGYFVLRVIVIPWVVRLYMEIIHEL